MSKPLNPRQLKFVERYLLTGNATQSYIDAGYKARGAAAENAASRLLGFDGVKAAIEAARQRGAENAALTAEWVFARLRIEAEREDKAASHAARVKSLELAAKLLGLLVEKTDVTSGGRSLVPVTEQIDKYTAEFMSKFDAAFEATAARERPTDAGGLPRPEGTG